MVRLWFWDIAISKSHTRMIWCDITWEIGTRQLQYNPFRTWFTHDRCWFASCRGCHALQPAMKNKPYWEHWGHDLNCCLVIVYGQHMVNAECLFLIAEFLFLMKYMWNEQDLPFFIRDMKLHFFMSLDLLKGGRSFCVNLPWTRERLLEEPHASLFIMGFHKRVRFHKHIRFHKRVRFHFALVELQGGGGGHNGGTISTSTPSSTEVTVDERGLELSVRVTFSWGETDSKWILWGNIIKPS